MKWVMSVSLGDPIRDHVFEGIIEGERVILERRGAGGDLRRAQEIIRRYDGQVTAFGLGGVNLYYTAGGSRYRIPEGWALRDAASKSPVADGSGVKQFVEPLIIDHLAKNGVQFCGKRGAVSSALDRWHLARAMETAGCSVTVCDAAAALRLPVLFRGTASFERAARLTMPLLRRIPLRMLYPLGPNGGSRRNPGFRALGEAFRRADIIAGDTYLLWRGLPEDLRGKVVIATTATDVDIAALLRRGAGIVATVSPSMGGRSFGANVTEAVIAAFDGRPPDAIPAASYREWWDRLGFRFRIEMGINCPA